MARPSPSLLKGHETKVKFAHMRQSLGTRSRRMDAIAIPIDSSRHG
jgi:hypothetical protein